MQGVPEFLDFGMRLLTLKALPRQLQLVPWSTTAEECRERAIEGNDLSPLRGCQSGFGRVSDRLRVDRRRPDLMPVSGQGIGD